MAQAAATPKTRFSGTTQGAVSSVSRMALSASGSVTARQYTAMPSAKAWVKTAASGTKRNSREEGERHGPEQQPARAALAWPARRRSTGLCMPALRLRRRRLHAWRRLIPTSSTNESTSIVDASAVAPA